ncbi:MAG TPA: four helix bundle protein [Anaerolineales bacterium]|nr:four helix bundle protein [Anaerolineales bacterium]
MRYVEWQAGVPDEIKGDSLWKLEVYRLGLFAADIAWQDALVLNKNPLTRGLADQLYRAVCSISANIAEGYSRSTGKDRARFLEYSLGSARESRDWYFKSRHTLKEEVVKHRIDLLTQIIKMLSILTPNQRQKGIREEQAEYIISQPSEFNIDLETPLP